MHAEHELFQLEIRYFCTNEMQKKKCCLMNESASQIHNGSAAGLLL